MLAVPAAAETTPSPSASPSPPTPGPEHGDLQMTTNWEVFETSYVFHAIVENLGPRVAKDVVVYLRAGAHSYEPIEVEGSEGCVPMEDDRFECAIGDMPVGATRTRDLSVARPVCGMWLEAYGHVVASNDASGWNNGGMSTGFDPPTCDNEADAAVTGDGVRGEDGRAIVDFTWANLGPAATQNGFFYIHFWSQEGAVDWSLETPVEGCAFDEREYLDSEPSLYCHFETVEPGESRTVRLLQTSGICGAVTLSAHSNFPNEADYSNNHAEVSLPSCGFANVGVRIHLMREYGNTTSVQMIFEDRGYTAARDVDVTGSITAVESGWNVSAVDERCALDGEDLRCHWPALRDEWSRDQSIYLWSTTTCEPLVINATITAANDPYQDNNSATIVTPDLCDASADLAVDHAWWETDESYGYKTTVTNTGNESSQETLLHIVDYERHPSWRVTPLGPCGYNFEDDYDAFTCHLDPIEPGESVVYEFSLDGPPCGPERVSFARAEALNEYHVDNNVMGASHDPPTCPHEADLAVTLDAHRGADGRGIVDVVVTNSGPRMTEYSSSVGWQLVEYDGTTEWFVIPPEGWYCDFDGMFGWCPLEGLAPGDSRAVSIQQREQSCGQIGVNVHAYASNEADEGDNSAELWGLTCGDVENPTPTTPIPVFPSALAWSLAAVGSFAGAFLVLRRRWD